MKEILPNSKNFKNEEVLLYINKLINKLGNLKAKSYPSRKQSDMEDLYKNLKVIIQNIQQATLFANDEEFMNNFKQAFQDTIARLNKDCESLKNQKNLLLKDIENIARMKKNNSMKYIETNETFDTNKKFREKPNIKFSSFARAVEYSTNKYFYRLIIQPKPTWLSHEDLWQSGFGDFWDMAHEEIEKQFIIIIQNYNIALSDCYGQYLWNILGGYTNFMPLSKSYTKGRPNNLSIYISPVEDSNGEISLASSQYVENIIKDKFAVM